MRRVLRALWRRSVREAISCLSRTRRANVTALMRAADLTWAFGDFNHPDLAWPGRAGPVENLAEILARPPTGGLECSDSGGTRSS